jgi:alpha-tubulin suppressor-like RCC1 family protein
MKSLNRRLILAASPILLASLYTLGIHGSAVELTPANPSLLVGGTLTLTQNGAVTPVSIAAGAWHTCVMYTDQSIRCTGLNNQGEIGNNDYHSVSEPTVAIGTVNPGVLLAGNEHTCTYISDGRMQCWGTNYTGQLGDGTIGGFALTPQFVHNISTAIKAFTGGYHTCAMLADHTIQCWGRNQDGQIGNGDSTTDVTLPVAVSGLGPVADLSAGGYHNCALLTDGEVACWGRNSRGQIGDGTDVTPVTQPHLVGGLTAAALSLGGYHSCALLADGSVQCWGQNDYGQVGSAGVYSAVPVTVAGLANVTALTSGMQHTCATLADGSVRCWGNDTWGQLGDGTTTSTFTPVAVQGIVNPRQVDAGWGHTCALMQDASVWCWGQNDYGELGDGTVTSSPMPVKMHLTGMTWTSDNPSVATVSQAGVVTGVARGTATISVTDPFGNSGSATVTVRDMLSLGVIAQGDGGGTVTSAPAGIACPANCSGSFLSDSQVVLTASPRAADSDFAGWTGCDAIQGATCTVTMSNARSVTATFTLRRFAVTVTESGLGKGTVTSSPAGIDCGTHCTGDFVINTTVTLTAAPALLSIFTGWTGCDSVNGSTCTVLVTKNTTVTAAFLGIPLP